MNLQPYQIAGEEIQRKNELPIKGISHATSFLAGATLPKAVGRILPFLNKSIPLDLMQKGINKINPKIGKFINGALGEGYDLEEIREFLNDKLQPGNSIDNSGQETDEKRHINPLQNFETNYPDIAGALARTMQNGQSPQAAAAILKQSTPFSKSIKKLESEVGKNFVDYVLELFGPQTQQNPQGGGQMNQPMQPQMGQPQPQQGMAQQDSGGLDQQIMAALDKILKM